MLAQEQYDVAGLHSASHLPATAPLVCFKTDRRTGTLTVCKRNLECIDDKFVELTSLLGDACGIRTLTRLGIAGDRMWMRKGFERVVSL